MTLHFNSKLFQIQLIALNAFVIVATVVAYLLSGNFLLVFVLLAVLFNSGWYIFIYRARRVVTISVKDHELILSYNRGESEKRVPLNQLKLEFEQRRGVNDNDFMMLVIKEEGTTVQELKPGNSGFTREELEELVSHCS